MNKSGDDDDGPASPGLDGRRSEKSPGGRTRPIPPAFESIQVNGCKTPGCKNFGVPPREGPILTGRRSGNDDYAVMGAGSTNLSCKLCGRQSQLKSNKGVVEERRRQGAFLAVSSPLRCPDEACANHMLDRGSKVRQFRRFGKTRSGSDRWQCCACKKTFSIGKPTLRQQKPHLNAQAFGLLVNKVPLSRIAELLEVGMPTVYAKIDFIFEQCKLFAASRESRLPLMRFERLYLCTDRQDYMVNWGNRSSRRTIQLTAVATVDLRSGYAFGFVPNFDASMHPDDLEEKAEQAGDADKPYAMREYGHLWTKVDYETSLARAAEKRKTARADLEAEEVMESRQQLPSTGVQVHADYLMYGHYALLRSLLTNVGKVRFFLDQDPGLLGACLGSFSDRVKDRVADVVVVDIAKDLTTTERRSRYDLAKTWFKEECALYPRMSVADVRTKIMAERIAAARAASDDPDHALQRAWIEHPFPDIAEPRKRFRYVTDHGDYDDEHTANLLIMATLWPVDTNFNVIRRRLTYCERPIRAARRANGLWQIYAPYNPAMIEKLLFIYRVWHNYVWVSPKTGKTAAEGFGLAAGKIRTQDILYFDVRQFASL